MKRQEITAAQETLRRLCAAALRGEKISVPADIDWREVFRESKQQSVSLFAFQALKPSEAPEEWKRYAQVNLQNNAVIYRNHTRLHEQLTRAGIPYCILKGCSSARFYPDPLLRTMGDVDFFVQQDDLERTAELLRQADFSQEDVGEHLCHYVFCQDKFLFELHFSLAGMPEGEAGEKIRGFLTDMTEKSHEEKIENAIFRMPSGFHHGLIILMHTYHHLLSEGIGLRHLCDWAAFVNSFSDADFCNLFEEPLRSVGLWRFAQIMGCLVHTALEIPYRDWMGTVDEELCGRLLKDIFAGGNFGNKDAARTNQGLAISNRGKDGVDRNIVLQTVVSLNQLAKSRFPIFARVPVLRPFGWIALCFYLGVRILTGKRELPNLRGMVRESKERKALYAEFHLFETDW